LGEDRSVEIVTGLGRAMGYRKKSRHPIPSGLNYRSSLEKGDALGIVRSENKKWKNMKI
jgi:hypothetical protein